MHRNSLSHKRLVHLLRYVKSTGLFYWRTTNSKHAKGDLAGHCGAYWQLYVDGVSYLGHRLAVFYVTGKWPTDVVDHKDGDGTNNRWSNLRSVTQRVNLENQRRAQRGSASSMLGVYPQSYGAWFARISVRGVQIHLGTYPTKELAHRAYVDAKRKYHEGCTI